MPRARARKLLEEARARRSASSRFARALAIDLYG
jgi:hypothetical protein